MNMENKVTIISGASGGLGGTVSRAFYEAGATLVLLGSQLAGVQEVAASLGQERTLPLAANLSNPAGAEEVVRAALAQFGRVDILLNLAGGFGGGKPVSESAEDDLNRMLDINLRTAYNLGRAAVKPMLAQKWGRIINVGSRDALHGRPNYSAYAISKAGVLRLTESMAAEVQDYGITVNAIVPGTIDTEANRKNSPDADFSKWVKPAEIAATLLFLASEGAAAINGAAIPLYGRS
ncbi:MAG: 3-oxoacyl-ACP reductase [Anaerolineae bacterium]|nr:SDR family oxidoreductase [Anaerolineales bacterium]MCQ3979582.1 3-oxoacyl-ACP reductase [Anaerolineae bacterium]